MWGLGISSDLSGETLSHRERLALSYAEGVANDSNRAPDQLFTELRQAFQDSEIVELAFVIGFITMLSRFNNVLQIRYGGELQTVSVS